MIEDTTRQSRIISIRNDTAFSFNVSSNLNGTLSNGVIKG